MKSSKINYTVVGTFVIAMVAGLVVAIALLTGRTGATDEYFTVYDDATGLKFGSQVLYMGFPVGQVEEITPDTAGERMRFRIRMSITRAFRNWKVPTDSYAKITVAGLLAATTIDIRVGRGNEWVEPDHVFDGRGQTDLFGAVSDTANSLKDIAERDVRPLIAKIDRYVTTFGNALETHAPPLLANLNRLSQHIADRAPQIVESFLGTTEEISLTFRRLRTFLTAENAEQVDETVDNVVVASENLRKLTEEARTYMAALFGPKVSERVDLLVGNITSASANVLDISETTKAGVDRVLREDNLARLDAIIANATRATEHVEALAASAREQLAVAFGPQDAQRIDEMIASLHGTSAEIDALVRETRSNLRAVIGASTAAKVDSTLTSLDAAAAETRRNLDGLIGPVMRDRVDTVMDNVTATSANVRTISESAEARIARVLSDENLAHVDAVVLNLRRASDDVAQMAASTKANLTVAFGEEDARKVDQTIADLRLAAADVRGLVSDTRGNLKTLLGPNTASKVDSALTNFSRASANVADLSESVKESLGDVLTPETAAKLQRALDNVGTAAHNIAVLTTDLKSTRQHIDDLLIALNQVVAENRPDVRESIRHLRYTLSTVAQHIDAISQNLEGTSRNMYEFSRQVRQNPGVLLRGATPVDDAVPTSGRRQP
jgi:phospholipid/cholesterol/gamma-HCH transport system substrate-binding protein